MIFLSSWELIDRTEIQAGTVASMPLDTFITRTFRLVEDQLQFVGITFIERYLSQAVAAVAIVVTASALRNSKLSSQESSDNDSFSSSCWKIGRFSRHKGDVREERFVLDGWATRPLAVCGILASPAKLLKGSISMEPRMCRWFASMKRTKGYATRGECRATRWKGNFAMRFVETRPSRLSSSFFRATWEMQKSRKLAVYEEFHRV